MEGTFNYIETKEIRHLLELERTPSTYTIHIIQDQKPCTKFDFLIEDLDLATTDQETLRAYKYSVQWLSVIYEYPDVDYIFKFVVKVGVRFVELLAQHDPRTLTIVGYWFMILATRDQVWWTPRVTGREFWGLMGLLPDEWKPRMQWAVQEFGERRGSTLSIGTV
jgi:hypothetical protein